MDDPFYHHVAYASTSYKLQLSQIREVWAMVSDNPGISIRAMAKKSGISFGKTAAILDFLVKCGTVKVEKGQGGTARAPIPLLTKTN